MKTAYLKKVVSNIVPVLASVCWMRSVYHTQYSVLQDLFAKFLSMGYRKCYIKENISKILRRMKENGGDFSLRRYSGGISFQNTSPVENYEDNMMLTWNPVNKVLGGKMNFKIKMKWCFIALIILTLVACSSSPAAIDQAPTLSETHSFEEQATGRVQENGGNEVGLFDQDKDGNTSESIPKINDTLGAPTPTAEPALTASNTTTAGMPVADQDLTHLLTENNIYLQYGKPDLHLVDDHQLLVWFDTAALIDLHSDSLLSITRVTTDPSDQKVDFTKRGVGLFKKDPMCMEGAWDTMLGEVFPNEINCMAPPIILVRYDFKLNLIDTLDLSQIFDLRFDLLRPIQCALSQSGEKLACAKNETSQVLLYDLQTKAQKVVFDFSWTNFSSFRGIDSMTFAGNDQYLAFTALDESGYDYGLVDLKQNQLVEFTKWNAIAEDFQTTENAIYFHEQLNGPQYPRSGKTFKIDLDTLEKQEFQFSDIEESKYVTVSKTGKYIATVMDTAAPGAAFPKGSIKIYDGQTMALIRQIDLERGFPSLVIDEANRFLIAYYFVDRDIKLFRYGF